MTTPTSPSGNVRSVSVSDRPAGEYGWDRGCCSSRSARHSGGVGDRARPVTVVLGREWGHGSGGQLVAVWLGLGLSGGCLLGGIYAFDGGDVEITGPRRGLPRLPESASSACAWAAGPRRAAANRGCASLGELTAGKASSSLLSGANRRLRATAASPDGAGADLADIVLPIGRGRWPLRRVCSADVTPPPTEQDGVVGEAPEHHRFYGDLAAWWPLISPPEDYAEEAAFAATVLHPASIPVREVLELGSGGGHNAVHLKAQFAMTLVDLSDEMLACPAAQPGVRAPAGRHANGAPRAALRRRLRPRRGRLHDHRSRPARAIDTAFVHCRPGGVAVFVPDDTAETFEPETDHGGSDGADGRGVRFLEWAWDPDPTDTWALTEYAFLLREADGSVRVVHETHRTGLFVREIWLRSSPRPVRGRVQSRR